MVKLSTLFSISGDFTNDGGWIEIGPMFNGKILVDEVGKFCGYCEQHYTEGDGGRCDEDACEAVKMRGIVGAIAKEGDGYSLLFYKLSNAPWQAPLLYEIHDASPTNCIWSAKDPGGGFIPRGNARVSLEELPYSKEIEDGIKVKFGEVDLENDCNKALVQEVGSWRKEPLVLWMK